MKKIYAVISFFVANPIFAYVLVGLIVFLIIAGAINSNCRKMANERDKKRAEEIQKTAGKIEVLEGERKEINANTKILEIESNRAAVNFNAVRDTDSASRDANFGTVRRKFCQEFPKDSRCR